MGKILKPKVLGDVYSGARTNSKYFYGSKRRSSFGAWPLDSGFSRLGGRVNLHGQEVFIIPLTKIFQFLLVVAAFFFLAMGAVFAPTVQRAAGQESDEERRALEAQLADLERQIDEYESQVVSYQKQGSTLKSEISRLNDKIAKLNLQIQAINLTLRELDRKIEAIKAKIFDTERTIAANKNVLARLLQNLYENERVSMIEVFLENPRLSDFFGNIQGIILLQNNLRVAVEEIIDLRDQLRDQKEQLSLARADAENAKNYREAQKKEINSTKAEKDRLLRITKGQESKYQELLKQTKATAAEIRKRIFKLLGGGELSFEEAYNFAKLASGATGVRPALILAVLDRESALGQNVGRCNYKTAMSPSNQKIFLEITGALGINPDVVTVSCPNRDGVYGGAMGPAQFIPSTWQLYAERVAKITGNNPPSPWNNADAFVATALYLKDSLNSCESFYSASASKERCAAARYYAGGRWRGYLWTYGEAVVVRAQRFEEDIATITS